MLTTGGLVSELVDKQKMSGCGILGQVIQHGE
jgi:hypothetical protein